MKGFLKFLFSFALFCILACAFSESISANFNIAPVVSVLALTALVVAHCILPKKSNPDGLNIMQNGIEVEFWVKYIMKRFWKDNAFLKHAFNEDDYVIGGKIVHIPQPGGLPTVVKNRNVFPATAVRRTDGEVLYSLDEYSTDPTHIQDAEKIEVSYDKIDSVLGDHVGQMNQTIATDMIIKWLALLPSSHIVETSGVSTSAKVAGQTGNRLATVHTDLKKARLIMNLQDVPGEDRYSLFEENMMDELTDSLSTTQYKDFSQHYDAKTGVIGKLYNFNIMTRSSVAMSAAALNGSSQLVANALGAATSATDQVTSLCWHKDAVTRAIGEVKVFEDINNPLYFGDVYSALSRMGGRRRRADSTGLVAIRQKAA